MKYYIIIKSELDYENDSIGVYVEAESEKEAKEKALDSVFINVN